MRQLIRLVFYALAGCLLGVVSLPAWPLTKLVGQACGFWGQQHGLRIYAEKVSMGWLPPRIVVRGLHIEAMATDQPTWQVHLPWGRLAYRSDKTWLPHSKLTLVGLQVDLPLLGLSELAAYRVFNQYSPALPLVGGWLRHSEWELQQAQLQLSQGNTHIDVLFSTSVQAQNEGVNAELNVLGLVNLTHPSTLEGWTLFGQLQASDVLSNDPYVAANLQIPAAAVAAQGFVQPLTAKDTGAGWGTQWIWQANPALAMCMDNNHPFTLPPRGIAEWLMVPQTNVTQTQLQVAWQDAAPSSPSLATVQLSMDDATKGLQLQIDWLPDQVGAAAYFHLQTTLATHQITQLKWTFRYAKQLQWLCTSTLPIGGDWQRLEHRCRALGKSPLPWHYQGLLRQHRTHLRLALADNRLQLGHTQFRIGGELALQPNRYFLPQGSLQLEGFGQNEQLAWPNLGQLQSDWAASFNLQLFTYGMHVDGALRLFKLQRGHYRWQDVTTQLNVHSAWQFPYRIRHGELRLRTKPHRSGAQPSHWPQLLADVRATWTPVEQWQAQALLRVQPLTLAMLTATLNHNSIATDWPAWLQTLHGRMQLHLKATHNRFGTITTLQLKASQLCNGACIDSPRLQLRTNPNHTQISLHFWHNRRYHAAFAQTGRHSDWQLRAYLPRLKLGLLQALLPAEAAASSWATDSAVAMHVKMHGPLQALQGAVRLSFYPDRHQPWLARRRWLAQGTIVQSWLSLQLRAHGTKLGALTLQLQPPYRFGFESTLSKLPVAAFFPKLLAYNPMVSLSMHGEGELQNLAYANVQAHLEHVQAHIGDVAIELAQPSALHWDGQAWQSELVVLHGPHYRSELRGHANRQGFGVDVQLQGSGDFLAGLLPENMLMGGQVDVQLHGSGTWHAPDWQGDITMHGQKLHWPQDATSAFEVQDGYASLHQHVLILHRLHLRQAEQILSLQGQITHWLSSQPHFNLQYKTEKLHLPLASNFWIQVSGQGSLIGPHNDVLAEGNFHLDSAQYRLDIELDAWLALLRKTKTYALSRPWPLRFNIKLLGERHLYFHSSILEAELAANLTLTGSLQRPGLLGSLKKINATAQYRDTLFDISRADIQFIDPYRIVAAFMVQAHAKACNMDILLMASGNSDAYQFFPTGRDEHGPVSSQDVLSCLQFGLRLQEFSRYQRNLGGISGALPNAAVDALWTISGLQSTVKRLLPLGVDELRFTSMWSQSKIGNTTHLVLGKKISDKLSLRGSRSLDETGELNLSFAYQWRRNSELQGSYSTQLYMPVGDFGIDMKFFWGFP